MAGAESSERIPSTDGFELASFLALPEGEPAGLVVLCHGLTTGADDDGPFLPMRDRLLRSRLAVLRFDARCHGATGGGWEDLSLRGWTDDILAAAEYARGLTERLAGDAPSPPLALLAASFAGGPAVRAAAALGGLAALVLWNPLLDYERGLLSADHPAGAAVLATGGDGDLPSWAEYRIPWAGATGVGLSSALVAEMRADETATALRQLEVPTLVLHGGRDRFVPYEITRAIARAAPAARFVGLPPAGHGFRFMRPIVRELSARWIARETRLRPGPRGR